MRRRQQPVRTAAVLDQASGQATVGQKNRQRTRWWRKLLFVLVVLVALLGIGRAILPWFLRDYVNRTLDRNPLYAGKIGDVHVQLRRGAYSIDDVRISKTSGNVPVPLFAAKRVDF